MQSNFRKTVITLPPEWEKDLDQLKKERFRNQSQADMLRYLISLGLGATGEEQSKNKSGR